MTIVSEPGGQPLVERVKGILLQPSAEWTRIDAEAATIPSLFTRYAMIVAAIPAVCAALGGLAFGYGMPGVISFHPSPVSVVVQAVVGWALSLVMVFALGLIIDALAPTFGGTRDRVKAMQVAVYSYTAAWLAGVFAIFPPAAALGVVGLYSFYLLYRGLPRLMRAPQEKAGAYLGVTILCGIVLAVVVAAVMTPLRMMEAMGGVTAGAPGVVRIGGTTMDTARLDAASRQMQAAAAQMQVSAVATQAGAAANGAVQGVSAEQLKALLPATIGGFARGDVTADSAGAGGSHASGDYSRGDAHLSLQVTDLAAMAGITGMAGAFNVNHTKETATGYEKMSTEGGRIVTEEYDRSSRHGKYGVVSGRSSVEAEGDNVTIDELKAAVNAVDSGRLQALARG